MSIAAAVLLIAGWGVYKLLVSRHAVDNAQLAKDYAAQKDSTKTWKESFVAGEAARRNLNDSLEILDGLLRVSHNETSKWHEAAIVAKGKLITITRPLEADSTNPKWMHRAIELEKIVASQDKELAGKDAEMSIMSTKQKLLISQMSKDSATLHSANGNIDRLNKLVDQYKEKSECRVAWILPCMSRTQAFIAGGIVGAGTVVLINRGIK